MEITLTTEQANTLSFYILSTTQCRKEEMEAWEKLATERNADGTERFPNAKPNARYYSELEEKLNEILKIL